MGADIVRVQLEDGVEIVERGIQIALGEIGVAAIGKDILVLRLLFENAVAIGERLVEAPHQS